MIFQHKKIHKTPHSCRVCVNCYDKPILSAEEHIFAISCCVSDMIADARQRGVGVEPLIATHLRMEVPDLGLSAQELFNAHIFVSDAWARIETELREAWSAIDPSEMKEHFERSLTEGRSHLPDVPGADFLSDEEFDCMTFEEWIEQLSEVLD